MSPEDNIWNKRLLLASALTILTFLVVGVGLFIYRSSSRSKQTTNPTEILPTARPDQINIATSMPLPTVAQRVDLRPAKKVEEIFYLPDQLDAEKSNPTPTGTKYQYVIDPSLLSPNPDKRTFRLIKSAYAQTPCATLTAPDSLNVFVLKSSLSSDDAGKLAASLGVNPTAYAAPKEAGADFDYFLTNAKSGASAEYILVNKSSGFANYHVPLSILPTDPGEATAKSEAESILAKLFGIYPTLFATSFSPSGEGQYTLNSKQKISPLKIVGPTSIEKLQSEGADVCIIPEEESTNSVSIHVNHGKTQNIFIRTRMVTDTKTLNTQSLIDAIKDSESTSLIEPEVIGLPARSNTKVTIKKVALVYADFGISKAQCLYSPIYLVQGEAQSDTGVRTTTVVSAFSAIPLKSLTGLCTPKPNLTTTPPAGSTISSAAGKADSIKYQSFLLPTKPVPTLGAYSGGKGTCTGNQVDYMMKCVTASAAKKGKSDNSSSFSGKSLCYRFYGARFDESSYAAADPIGICDKTQCKNESYNLSYPAGTPLDGLCEKYYNDVSGMLADPAKSDLAKPMPLPTIIPGEVGSGPTPVPGSKSSEGVECYLTVCAC